MVASVVPSGLNATPPTPPGTGKDAPSCWPVAMSQSVTTPLGLARARRFPPGPSAILKAELSPVTGGTMLKTARSVAGSAMTTSAGTLAGFAAFGAAIIAVLAGGGTLQKFANLWVDHARQEHPGNSRALLWCRKLIVIGTPALIIILVVLGSGAGMLFSFFWLRGGALGGWGWAYHASVVMFVFEVAGVTAATLFAVGAAVVTAGGLPGSAARKAHSNRAARVSGNDPSHAVTPTHASVDPLEYDVAAMTLATLVAAVAAGGLRWQQPERYPNEDLSQAAMSTADR